MKRFFTDIPQGILLNEVLTPLKRTTHQQAVNFGAPQIPGATPGVFPSCYQQMMIGQKETDKVGANSPTLMDFDDQLQTNMTNGCSTSNATYQAVFGATHRPFGAHYRKRDDSFIYRQMPSFNRLSFEEVMEGNREMALEGSVIPPTTLFKEQAFKTNHFEYLNNAAAAVSLAEYNQGPCTSNIQQEVGSLSNSSQPNAVQGQVRSEMEHSTPQLRSTRILPMRAFTALNGGLAFDSAMLQESENNQRIRFESINEEQLHAQDDDFFWGSSYLNALPKKATSLRLQPASLVQKINTMSEECFYEKLRQLEISSPVQNQQQPRIYPEDQDMDAAEFAGQSGPFNQARLQFQIQQEELNAKLSLIQTSYPPEEELSQGMTPGGNFGPNFEYKPSGGVECTSTEHFQPLVIQPQGPVDFDAQSVVSSSHSVASASTRSRKTKITKRGVTGQKLLKQRPSTSNSSLTSSQLLHQSIYLKDKQMKEFAFSNEVAMLAGQSGNNKVDEDSVTFAPDSSTELVLSSSNDITRRNGHSQLRGASTFQSQLIKVNKLSSSNLITRTSKKSGFAQQPLSRQDSSKTQQSSCEKTCLMGEDATALVAEIEEEHFIGPLTATERREKVLKYLHKKSNKSTMKKFCYKCRKQVAEKRLRIKGRFVTRQQAFEILGITYDELKSNEIIQRLLESHAGFMDGQLGYNGNCFSESGVPQFQLNSLFESEGGRKQIKIRNFQALIDDNYNHNSKMSFQSGSGINHNNSFMSGSFRNNQELSNNINGAQTTVPDELLRQIQLNLRISTGLGWSNGGSNVTKVLISSGGDSSNGFSVDEQLKMSLSSLRLEGNYYVQPIFKVERNAALNTTTKKFQQTCQTPPAAIEASNAAVFKDSNNSQ